MRIVFLVFVTFLIAPLSKATPSEALIGAAAEAAVQECLAGEGEAVELLSDGESVCWRSAIFPLEFLKLGEFMPDAKRLVLTSRGGNVLTAITMANYLRESGVPVIIAGQCVSACASVIAPGLMGGRIHESAFFLVHGITSFDADTFLADFKARKSDGDTSDAFVVGFMMPNAWNYYSVQWPRTVGFLEKRDIPVSYMEEPEARMIAAKDELGCPLELMDYFALLPRDHVVSHIGERFDEVDAFAGDWDDPRLDRFRDSLEPVGDEGVVVYKAALATNGCPS